MSLAGLKTEGTFGAIFLVTGCCIGAGMIGLPVMSALAGFLPSSIAMMLCYVFTTITGLLLVEATLWFEGERVNLPSIVEATLGKTGKVITLFLFLFLFYCLFVAYLDGGGLLFADILSALLHQSVSREIGILTCVSFVGAITYLGTKVVDNLNQGLLVGLAVSYLILVFVGLPNASRTNLAFTDWTATVATIPILLICFGYQNLVPSLTYYLKKNVNAIRMAIIIGNLLPLFIYMLWNSVILGMISPNTPLKDSGLVSELLQGATHSVSILFFIKSFSLLAILTSFLPIAVSFVDFLKDGFKKTLHREQKNHGVIVGLVFIPPLICSLLYPNLFLRALEFAGGFIDVLLFGILPALIILVGRNVKKRVGPYEVMGGNVTPIAVLVVSVFVLFIKLY